MCVVCKCIHVVCLGEAHEGRAFLKQSEDSPGNRLFLLEGPGGNGLVSQVPPPPQPLPSEHLPGVNGLWQTGL